MSKVSDIEMQRYKNKKIRVCDKKSILLSNLNVKMAEPIGPKFYVGPHVIPGKIYEWSKFQKLVFKSF